MDLRFKRAAARWGLSWNPSRGKGKKSGLLVSKGVTQTPELTRTENQAKPLEKARLGNSGGRGRAEETQITMASIGAKNAAEERGTLEQAWEQAESEDRLKSGSKYRKGREKPNPCQR